MHFSNLGLVPSTPGSPVCSGHHIDFDEKGKIKPIHIGDHQVFNGGRVVISNQWPAAGDNIFTVKNGAFYNCIIEGKGTLAFENCTFRNCYIGLPVEKLRLTACQLFSTSLNIITMMEIESASVFNKCYIRLGLRSWYPGRLKSHVYQFKDYLNLLRKYKGEDQPNVMIHDRWYDAIVNDLHKQTEDAVMGRPLAQTKGPIETLWGDAAEGFWKFAEEKYPAAAQALKEVDWFLSNNVLDNGLYKYIIYDWGSANR